MILGLLAAWASPLVEAVDANDLKAAATLLAEGADPHESIERSSTHRGFSLFRRTTVTTTVRTSPLHLAVQRALDGDTRLLTVFLQAGVDGTRATGSFAPPLHRATAAGPKGVRALTALLDGGVPAGQRFRHQTALAPAAHPAPAVVQALLEHGADPSVLICDAEGVEELDLLLAAGAEVDGDCPLVPVLLAAVLRQDQASVERLAGADLQRVAVVEGAATTALHTAAALGWAEGVGLLLDRGADPQASAGLFGQRPLEVATGPAVQLLLDAGALRTGPMPASAWTTPPRAGEQGAWLASWVDDDEVPLHGWDVLEQPEVRTRIRGFGADALLRVGDQLTPAGVELALAPRPACERPPMRRSDLFEVWGTPDRTEKQGLLRIWHWADRQAIGTGPIVAEVRGGCFADLVGQPRGVVWLALGVPTMTTPDLDVQRDGVRLRYTTAGFVEASHLGEPWEIGK